MTYLGDEKDKLSNKEFINTIVEVRCDNCNKITKMLGISAKRSWNRYGGKHICQSCTRKASPAVQAVLKARNSNWTEERKLAHSLKVKNSEKYRRGLALRPNTSGEKNHMFGKRHTLETKAKMSESRKGKIGEKATAWKGGKLSLVSRIRVYIQINHKWFTKCFERDDWTCKQCGSKKKLDVHHINPIKQIVKQALEGKSFNNEDEKYLYLIGLPGIIDIDLKNGITLCRECHRKIHNNWGSHSPQAKELNEENS